MTNRRKTIIKIIGCCLGVAFLGFCVFLAIMMYIAATTPWGTLLKDNMDDPEFRQEIEQWLDLKFPESAQWEKSEYFAWTDTFFVCVFTLPKKDIELMFPPEKGEWHENRRDFLHLPDKWLKGKNLNRFQAMRYEPEEISRVSVAYENPVEADENQRVWVYIFASRG